MKLAVLYSGGKDSNYALFKSKDDAVCLISVISKNKESYMFHTPSISQVERQAEAMEIPIMIEETKGKKEEELKDLERAIKKAKTKYKIQGIVTGAIRSVYQASRIQKICDKLGLECFNPLWQKEEFGYLNELIKNKFKVVIIGVFAFPLDEKWLGRMIDKKFIVDVKKLHEKYKIHPAGEGGEMESFVLDCPLFKKPLKIQTIETFGEKNSWKNEIGVK